MPSAVAEVKKTILLVEDEFLIAMMESRDLEAGGYYVIHAADGPEAVAVIHEKGEAIDLVLMDIDLGPGMDGTDAARQILEIRDLPVIFLSSHTEMEIVRKTEEITSYGYVVKNSGVTVLLASIRMAFRLFEANRKIFLKNNEILRASSRLMELNEELLRSRNSIAESEERYKRIFESFIDIYYRVDASGIITEVSPSVEELSGWSMGEVIGRSVRDVYLEPADRELFLSAIAREGRINGYEVAFKRRDGQVIPISIHAKLIFDKNGAPAGIEGTLRDISGRKRTEDMFYRTFEKYRMLVDNSVDMIWTMDTSGIITYVSPAWEKVLGYSPDYTTGKDFRVFLHPDDEPWCSGLILRGISSGERIKSPPYRLRNSDGTYRWHEAHGVAVYGRDGVSHLIVGISRDIHERKIDSDLLAAAKEASDSASLAKSEFIAKMSHEIRTPLNGVAGFTGLLCDSGLAGEQKGYAENAYLSAMCLLDLVDGIIDFSRIEAGMVEIEEAETDIPLLLENIREMTGYAAGVKGVEFRLEHDRGMPRYATVDAMRLRRVLINLAGNALRSACSGTVQLSAGFTPAGEESGLFRFSVSDAVQPVNCEAGSSIFSPFRQFEADGERACGGAGIGLDIAASLLESMGSSLNLVSDPERGRCFYFELRRPCRNVPVRSAESESPGFAAGEGGSRSFTPLEGNYTILIAEDNEINLELAKAFIKRLAPSAVIVEARDGAEALGAWKDRGADIIFMDVQMPVMDGYAVTAGIRELEKQSGIYTPVIALTAGAVSGEREKCLDSGMDDCIVQPADLRKLSALLVKYLVPGSGAAIPPENAAGSAPSFNYVELLNRLGGDDRLLSDMLAISGKYFGGYVSDLMDAVSAGDHKRISRQLHLLKGAALNACFSRLAELVCEFEKSMPSDDGIMKRFAQAIEDEYGHVKDEIAASGLAGGSYGFK